MLLFDRSLAEGTVAMARIWIGAVCLLGTLMAAEASAGWPWPARIRPYQASVDNYVVVEPVPGFATGVGKHGAPNDHVEFPWRAHELPTPSYPYGWFGARVQPQHQTHHSYYGTYRERMLRW